MQYALNRSLSTLLKGLVMDASLGSSAVNLVILDHLRWRSS